MNNNYKHFFISINDISSSLTGERIKDRLPVWDRYVLRVPSFYLAYFLYNIIGLSANAVSVVSAIYAIILFVFVFYSPSNNIDIMLLMINIWPLLDCADGNIARSLAKKYNIKNVYGELYDAIAGWVVLGGLWITIGFYLTLSYANIIYLILN